MIEIGGIILASMIGLIVGVIVGLAPGFGVSTTFLLLAPWLVYFHPVYALFLFVSMLISSQYFGSITAMVYGVPGEISSFPVISERSALVDKIDTVLAQTALGSLIAAMAAIGIFVLLMNFGNVWLYVYNYQVFAVIMTVAVVATLLFGSKNNTVLINTVLFVCGYGLAKIGYSKEFGQSWGTFGLDMLYTGIPLPAVALGLLVIPAVFASWHHNVVTSYVKSVIKHSMNWASVVRGTVLGVVGGLVPGVTYLASTQLSYAAENFVNKDHPDRPMRAVVSASSADNAGATSSLYPMLYLGIPITVGEAMVIWLFEKQNLHLSWNLLQQPVNSVPLTWLLIMVFLSVNLISYALSWPGRMISIQLASKLMSKHSAKIIITVVCLSIVALSLESVNIGLWWASFATAAAIGLIWRNIDWTPAIIGFILQDSLELTLFKLGVLSL